MSIWCLKHTKTQGSANVVLKPLWKHRRHSESKENWIKAQPELVSSVTINGFSTYGYQICRGPERHNDFLTKHIGPTGAVNHWIERYCGVWFGISLLSTTNKPLSRLLDGLGRIHDCLGTIHSHRMMHRVTLRWLQRGVFGIVKKYHLKPNN